MTTQPGTEKGNEEHKNGPNKRRWRLLGQWYVFKNIFILFYITYKVFRPLLHPVSRRPALGHQLVRETGITNGDERKTGLRFVDPTTNNQPPTGRRQTTSSRHICVSSPRYFFFFFFSSLVSEPTLRFTSWGLNSSLISTFIEQKWSSALYLIPCTKKFEGKRQGNAQTRVSRKSCVSEREIFSKSLSQNGTPLKVPGSSQSLCGVPYFRSPTGGVVLVVVDVAPIWI